MIRLAVLVASTAFIFGCTTNTKIERVCIDYPFVLSSSIEPVTVRVHKDDKARYEDYITALRMKSEEYERQINDYKGNVCNQSIEQ